MYYVRRPKCAALTALGRTARGNEDHSEMLLCARMRSRFDGVRFSEGIACRLKCCSLFKWAPLPSKESHGICSSSNGMCGFLVWFGENRLNVTVLQRGIRKGGPDPKNT